MAKGLEVRNGDQLADEPVIDDVVVAGRVDWVRPELREELDLEMMLLQLKVLHHLLDAMRPPRRTTR
jgi:hypothetical protein